jgi:hypothetical protein
MLTATDGNGWFQKRIVGEEKAQEQEAPQIRFFEEVAVAVGFHQDAAGLV